MLQNELQYNVFIFRHRRYPAIDAVIIVACDLNEAQGIFFLNYKGFFSLDREGKEQELEQYAIEKRPIVPGVLFRSSELQIIRDDS